tara:strand:+ start:179 stop:397 length:219 start_codon:yes stop_codon:yes gene_type:complete
LNIYPNFTLQLFDCFALRFVNETYDGARGTRSSGSSASMHVGFPVFRGVKMKNTFNPIYMDTPGSYISGDED